MPISIFIFLVNNLSPSNRFSHTYCIHTILSVTGVKRDRISNIISTINEYHLIDMRNINHVITNHKLIIHLSDFSASAVLKYLVWFFCFVASPKQTPYIIMLEFVDTSDLPSCDI